MDRIARRLVAIAVGLGVAMAGAATLVQSAQAAPSPTFSAVQSAKILKAKNSKVMTKREYKKIKKGMTTKQVRRIVGTSGYVWECAPNRVCSHFFRSAASKKRIVNTFKTGKVVAKHGYPGSRGGPYLSYLPKA